MALRKMWLFVDAFVISLHATKVFHMVEGGLLQRNSNGYGAATTVPGSIAKAQSSMPQWGSHCCPIGPNPAVPARSSGTLRRIAAVPSAGVAPPYTANGHRMELWILCGIFPSEHSLLTDCRGIKRRGHFPAPVFLADPVGDC